MFRYELLRRDIQNDGRNCPVYLGSVEGSHSRPAHHIARDICSQAGFVALLVTFSDCTLDVWCTSKRRKKCVSTQLNVII